MKQTESPAARLGSALSASDTGTILPLTATDWDRVAHYMLVETPPQKLNDPSVFSERLSAGFNLLNKPELTGPRPAAIVSAIAREVLPFKLG